MSKTRTTQTQPTILFASMVAVAFAIRFLVGEICPTQELFLTALFSVGCGGLYGLHIDRLAIEVFSRYKFTGAAGISIALMFFIVPASDKDNPPSCQGLVRLACADARAMVRQSPPARQTQPRQDFNGCRMKIVYPIGNAALQKKATELESKLRAAFPKAKVEVWSRGSWRSAIVNSFKRFPQTVAIYYRKRYLPAQKQALVQTVARALPDFRIIKQEERIGKKPEDEISLELGL